MKTKNDLEVELIQRQANSLDEKLDILISMLGGGPYPNATPLYKLDIIIDQVYRNLKIQFPELMEQWLNKCIKENGTW